MKSLYVWAVFKIQRFVGKRFLPFFPSPSPFFYSLHFRAAILCSRTSQKRLLRRLQRVRTVSFNSIRKTSFALIEMEDVGSLLLVLELHDDFDGDISDIVWAVLSVVLFWAYREYWEWVRMLKWNGMERFISIGPVQPKKLVDLERWADLFQNFCGWTEF